MQIGTRARVAALMAMVFAAGCKGDKKDDASADAGAADAEPAQPVIGGKLGQAVAAAAAASAAQPAASAGAQGPPEGGVFAPGAGRAALPKDVPYKLEVINDGAEPRAVLAAQIDPKVEQKVTATLGIRMGGPQGLPNLDLDMVFKVDKPKGAAKEAPKAGADGAADAPSATPVAAKITAVTLASMGLGGLPKEASEQLAKLKGTTVRYTLLPENVAQGFAVELAKGAEGLEPVAHAAAETISVLTAPLPSKPVGVGAYWMVTDRAVWSGAQIPMLRYRVFKITKIDGATVTYSLDTRQYAEEGLAKVANGGQLLSLSIEQFDSAGKGELTWDPGALAPRTANFSQRLQARLTPPGAQSNQRMMIQTELSGKLRPPVAPPP